MHPPDTFPLITLQPVADAGNAWTAFLLRGAVPLDQSALERVLNGYGLAEILPHVACVAVVDAVAVDAAFPGNYAADRLRLLCPGDPLPPTASATAVAAPSKGDPGGRSLLLKLLALVTSDADAADLEALIKRDPNLSYQLLKLVNSAAFASSKKITNFSQAIALLGRRQLQRWLQLLLYVRPQGSTLASPLLPCAALRAALLEAVAKRQGLSHELQDRAFMVGMFSLLEALFGMPIDEIVAPLNLADDIVQALSAGAGPLGKLLGLALTSEGGPSAALAQGIAAAGLAHESWASALVEAVRWSVQISREA